MDEAKRGLRGGPTIKRIELTDGAAECLRLAINGDRPAGTRQDKAETSQYVADLIVRSVSGHYLPYVSVFEYLREYIDGSRPAWEANPKLELAASIFLGWLNEHAKKGTPAAR